MQRRPPLTALKIRREDLGQSQSDLSQITKIRQPRLSEIERGEGPPATDDELQRLGHALALPPDTLLQRYQVVVLGSTIVILPDNGRPLQAPERLA